MGVRSTCSARLQKQSYSVPSTHVKVFLAKHAFICYCPSMSTETLEEYKQRVARSGGHGRAANMTAKERKESAQIAAKARWAKKKKKTLPKE